MAQATRNELVKRHQQQQVSPASLKPKAALKSETKAGETTATTTTSAGNNKTKPSYKHIPHSQKPPHLVAKRNARERRRVKAVNEAFNTLKKCVPIQNRNKRVSKVKTLQRAIDHIRHLQALLEADNEAAGTSGGGQHRIFVSSKAGEEAEMRLAMSPEPRRRSTASATKIAKGPASLSHQVEESRLHRHQQQQQQQPPPQQKQRRGRKPNAIKQQEAAAATLRQQQVGASVLLEQEQLQQQQQQHQQNQHYLIESQTGDYASVPHGAPAPHYYSLPQATCHTTTGVPRTSEYAYANETPNQQHQQHYQSYETSPHYYQTAFQEQYQSQAPAYGAHYYSAANHQVPYGEADSATGQRQQQEQSMGWQPVQSSARSSRSSGGGPLDSSSGQLNGSPASSASLTQLMCNLNSSGSSLECSSSGSNATSTSCLYNGAAQQHNRRAMPADSTTSSIGCSSSNNNNNNNNNNNSNNKSASSLIDSPYSTASSSSGSSASTSFSGAGVGNKSLDSSAPLNLKHADKSAPTSAGGRQVNNYANSYSLPTFVYDPERQQPNDGAKLIGHQQEQQKMAATQQAGFLCGGDSASDLLYMAAADNNEQQRHQQTTSYAQNSSMDFHKSHHQSALLGQHGNLSMADQLALANGRATSNGLYSGSTLL